MGGEPFPKSVPSLHTSSHIIKTGFQTEPQWPPLTDCFGNWLTRLIDSPRATSVLPGHVIFLSQTRLMVSLWEWHFQKWRARWASCYSSLSRREGMAALTAPSPPQCPALWGWGCGEAVLNPASPHPLPLPLQGEPRAGLHVSDVPALRSLHWKRMVLFLKAVYF